MAGNTLPEYDLLDERFDSTEDVEDLSFKLLDDHFGNAPRLDETLDQATRTNPDEIVESIDAPVSNDVYQKNKPEIERQKFLTDINAAELKNTHPKTSKWLTQGKNAAVAIDDLDVLKGIEGTLRDREKGFFGLRFDDLKRGFANLKRTARYSFASSYMETAQQIALIDEKAPTDRASVFAAQEEAGLPRNFGANVTEYLYADTEKRREIKKRTSKLLLENIGKTAAHAREAAGIPRSAAGEKFVQAESFSEAWKVFTESPIEVATGVTTESLAQFAPAIPFMFAGAPLAIAGVGTTSFINEYASDVLGSMQEAGIDIESESALMSGLSDPEKMAQWKEHATKRGLPIAVIDALSMGIAGRLVALAETPAKKIVAGAGEALVVQPALGGAGEAAGAIVAGEEISGKDVLAEMLGEIAPGAVETVAGAYGQARIKAETKATEEALVSIGEQKQIDDIVTYAQSSTTNGRSPEHFESFVNSLGEDREILIPNEIAVQMEDAPAYISEQLNALGTNISIPLNKFVSEIAPNEAWMELIRPHIKLSENTLTQTELESGERGELQALLKKAQESQETLTEADQIFETVKDQIVATGLQGEATARYSAQLYPAAATVYVEKARKAGHDVSVNEIFEMMGFRVEAGVPKIDGEEGVILDQEINQLKQRIEKLKDQGTESPKLNERLAQLEERAMFVKKAEVEEEALRQGQIPADLEITMDREVIETGETVQEIFNARELNVEIDNKMESYKTLRDCL